MLNNLATGIAIVLSLILGWAIVKNELVMPAPIAPATSIQTVKPSVSFIPLNTPVPYTAPAQSSYTEDNFTPIYRATEVPDVGPTPVPASGELYTVPETAAAIEQVKNYTVSSDGKCVTALNPDGKLQQACRDEPIGENDAQTIAHLIETGQVVNKIPRG